MKQKKERIRVRIKYPIINCFVSDKDSLKAEILPGVSRTTHEIAI